MAAVGDIGFLAPETGGALAGVSASTAVGTLVAAVLPDLIGTEAAGEVGLLTTTSSSNFIVGVSAAGAVGA